MKVKRIFSQSLLGGQTTDPSRKKTGTALPRIPVSKKNKTTKGKNILEPPTEHDSRNLKVPVRGAFSRPQKIRKTSETSYGDISLKAGSFGHKPRLTITNDILSSITQIERFRGFLLGAKLSSRWIGSAGREALSAEAYHTTHIEGTALTFTRSQTILNNQKLANADPDDAEDVKNYQRVFELVASYRKNGHPITEVLIRDIHKALLQDIRGDATRPGEYRTIQKSIVNRKTGEFIYEHPGADEVPRLVSELVEWLRDGENIHPIVAAGVAHWQLVHIHPFIDGNKRTSRLLAMLVLCKAGYDFKSLFSIGEHYDLDANEYDKAFQSVQSNDMDMTLWLSYFAKDLVCQI